MEKYSQIMPNNWVMTTIDQVSKDIYYGYTAKARKEPIGPKYLRITDIQKDKVDWEKVPYCNIDELKIKKYVLRPGEIVFARTGATVGKSYQIKDNVPEAVFASYLIKIIPSDSITNKYISYYFKSSLYWTQIYEGQIGIGQPNVNATKLKMLTIPIPPFNEQVRIVSKIEELFSRLNQGVNDLQQTQQQLVQYQQSTLKQAFNGRLTQKWREKNPDIEDSQILLNHIQNDMNRLPNQRYKPSELDTEHLPEIPDKWSWVNLGKAFYTILGQSPPSSTYNENEEGLPFFQGSKEFQDYYPRIEKWCSKPKKIAEKEDILISVRAPVGDVNIAPIKCCIGRGLAAIRAVGDVDKMFVFYLIKYIQRDLDLKGTGTTFRAVTGDVLRNYPIPLPPLKEICYIVSELDKINTNTKSIVKNIRTSIYQLSILKQAILKRAFSGGLVPQDASDESASILLERITAEKAKLKPTRRHTRRRKSQSDFVFNLTPVKKTYKEKVRVD